MKTQRDWLTAVVMYIKCTRVASKRGITDDGRHTESRCTRLYLLLREKRNSCRACMRFARPPLPRTRIRRESFGRNRSDPWSHRIRARVCVCARGSRGCIEYLAKLVLEKIELVRVQAGQKHILSLFLLRQSRAVYNLRTRGYVLCVPAR